MDAANFRACRKFIAVKAYIKKVGTCPINNVALNLKILGNKEQSSRKMEIKKTTTERKEIDIKKTIKKLMKLKAASLKRLTKLANFSLI